MTGSIDTLSLQTTDGVTIVVPASLQSITAYVLLEQESWFEKEVAFVRHWLQPGMMAIDVGANLGVYSLPIAARVGPSGRVFAYEPASLTRELLARSREINRLDNLEIVGTALSNCEGRARLAFGVSSELNALGDAGPGEDVRVASLDREDAERRWPSIDFVKIDAEGEEERILEGGRGFFARHSPLVMFEVKAGTNTNEKLRQCFPAMGYRVFRLLAGAPVLVPDDPDAKLDASELNLFAAKTDRVRALADAGVLVEAVPDWTPGQHSWRDALALFRAQAFAPAFENVCRDDAIAGSPYGACLAAYGVWRNGNIPLAERCGALAYAYRSLTELCRRDPSTARLSTFARVAWESGQRATAIDAIQTIFEGIGNGAPPPQEPFWPASPRFDTIAPGAQPGLWFAVAAMEQLEKMTAFTSSFRRSPPLDWLAGQPFASTEMERRRVLYLLLTGSRLEVPERLCTPAADHLNAEIWRDAKVPGTWVNCGA